MKGFVVQNVFEEQGNGEFVFGLKPFTSANTMSQF